ncbi:MAG: hypothetical protein ACYS21_16360, partial [Planctomycetota bacterium]
SGFFYAISRTFGSASHAAFILTLVANHTGSNPTIHQQTNPGHRTNTTGAYTEVSQYRPRI